MGEKDKAAKKSLDMKKKKECEYLVKNVADGYLHVSSRFINYFFSTSLVISVCSMLNCMSVANHPKFE